MAAKVVMTKGGKKYEVPVEKVGEAIEKFGMERMTAQSHYPWQAPDKGDTIGPAPSKAGSVVGAVARQIPGSGRLVPLAETGLNYAGVGPKPEGGFNATFNRNRERYLTEANADKANLGEGGYAAAGAIPWLAAGPALKTAQGVGNALRVGSGLTAINALGDTNAKTPWGVAKDVATSVALNAPLAAVTARTLPETQTMAPRSLRPGTTADSLERRASNNAMEAMDPGAFDRAIARKDFGSPEAAGRKLVTMQRPDGLPVLGRNDKPRDIARNLGMVTDEVGPRVGATRDAVDAAMPSGVVDLDSILSRTRGGPMAELDSSAERAVGGKGAGTPVGNAKALVSRVEKEYGAKFRPTSTKFDWNREMDAGGRPAAPQTEMPLGRSMTPVAGPGATWENPAPELLGITRRGEQAGPGTPFNPSGVTPELPAPARLPRIEGAKWGSNEPIPEGPTFRDGWSWENPPVPKMNSTMRPNVDNGWGVALHEPQPIPTSQSVGYQGGMFNEPPPRPAGPAPAIVNKEPVMQFKTGTLTMNENEALKSRLQKEGEKRLSGLPRPEEAVQADPELGFLRGMGGVVKDEGEQAVNRVLGEDAGRGYIADKTRFGEAASLGSLAQRGADRPPQDRNWLVRAADWAGRHAGIGTGIALGAAGAADDLGPLTPALALGGGYLAHKGAAFLQNPAMRARVQYGAATALDKVPQIQMRGPALNAGANASANAGAGDNGDDLRQRLFLRYFGGE